MTFQKIALIPAYKPDDAMTETVSRLNRNGFDVIVVNDGSGPDYNDQFRRASYSAEILEHDVNRGKGAALKTGLEYISRKYNSPYVVVTADADGQHTLRDIIRVCAAAEQEPDKLILGSRKFDKDVPLRSRFGNWITRIIYRLSSGTRVSDTQTGLRAFCDRLVPKMLKISGSRYEYEMNVLMELPRSGTGIKEIWIETVYLDGNSSSHFNPLKDSVRIYREILKYSASSLISFLVDYGLFCMLSFFTGMTVFSNVTARVCSSIVNFSLNRKFVFSSDQKITSSALKYFTLAAAVLIMNTLILKALSMTGLSTYAAKIITEIILFVLNYLVQRKIVFRKKQSQQL